MRNSNLRANINSVAVAVADHAVMLDRYNRGEVTRDAVVTKQESLNEARAALLVTIEKIEASPLPASCTTPLPGDKDFKSNITFAGKA